jgi:hypothetical protein
MANINNIASIIVACFVVAIAGYVFHDMNGKTKEGYSSSALTNVGSFSDYPNTCNTDSYNPFYPEVKMTEFYTSPNNKMNSNQQKTIQRLDRLEPHLLPATSQNVTPYNIDVADPIAYSFVVNAPRVIRKDRLALQADPFRGDIPINIYPDIPIIQRSQYNRDSLRIDGAFSDALSQTYNKLTGKAYFNQPIYNSTGGMQS